MAKFIAKAIKHPGREKAAAKRAGMSTHAYMEKHEEDQGSAGAAARLGLRLEAMHGGKKKSAAHTLYPGHK